jgi:hypothetical protein
VDGKFDLDQWNDEYWRRFENFLKLTHERDIIVQIEIWATWDHYEDHQSLGGWSKHPFNPANNITYTPRNPACPRSPSTTARQAKPTDHPFSSSVPALENNTVVLRYQTGLVDKLLSYSLLPARSVLHEQRDRRRRRVERFLGRYVRAGRRGRQAVETAEMRRSGNITTPTIGT